MVTLVTPWRGTPFANYVNEINTASSESTPFGRAPVNGGTALLKDWIVGVPDPFTGKSLVGNVRYPCWQVMGMESPWLRWMTWGTLDPTAESPCTAFRDDVGYGAIGGEGADYLFTSNAFRLARDAQEPCWFPYLSEDYDLPYDSMNDGLVPIWSSLIPGSQFVSTGYIGSTHDYLPFSSMQFELAMLDFNTEWEAYGKDLRDKWSTSVYASNRTWKFRPGKLQMAYHDGIYDNVGNVARIDPNAIRELNRFSLTQGVSPSRAAVSLTWYSVIAIVGYNHGYKVVLTRDGVSSEISFASADAGRKTTVVNGPFEPGHYQARIEWTSAYPGTYGYVALTTKTIEFDIP